jgi:hypothetical protein
VLILPTTALTTDGLTSPPHAPGSQWAPRSRGFGRTTSSRPCARSCLDVLVDSALRRRFYFAGFLPTEEPVKSVLTKWQQAKGLQPEPATLLGALNEAIGDDDFSIEPSYFMTEDGRAPDSKESGNTRSSRCWRSISMSSPILMLRGDTAARSRPARAAATTATRSIWRSAPAPGFRWRADQDSAGERVQLRRPADRQGARPRVRRRDVRARQRLRPRNDLRRP